MIEKRLRNIESKCYADKNEPIIKFTFSDGHTETMDILDAFSTHAYDWAGELEPHIIKAEVVQGREKAPKLCDIVIQCYEWRSKLNGEIE